MNRDFTIVFNHLDESASAPIETAAVTQSLTAEIDDIAELRRIVVEITEPEPLFFTTS